jgi:hypothetical protein
LKERYLKGRAQPNLNGAKQPGDYFNRWTDSIKFENFAEKNLKE